MSSLPPFKSPGGNRRVLQSSTLRDASQSASTSTSQQLPRTPSAASSRRKSTKERTPRQVTALLSARKLQARRSLGVGATARGEDTPGGLIRALSRMPDLPPPTPEELEQVEAVYGEQEEEEDADSDLRITHDDPTRRDSILGHPLPDESSSAEEEDAALASTSQQHARAPRSSFFTSSLGDGSYPAAPAASASTSAAAAAYALARSALVEEREEEEEDDDDASSGSDVAASLLSGTQSQGRSQRQSVVSVDLGRRESVATSGFGSPGLVGRRISQFSALGDDVEDGEEETRRRGGKVSMGSELGVGGGRNSLGSTVGGRPSLAFSTGDEGAEEQFAFESGDDDEQEQPQYREDDEQVEGFPEVEEFALQEEYGGGEELEDDEHFGDAGEEDDVDEEQNARIPWDEKGKGRAAEDDVDQDAQDVWEHEQESDGEEEEEGDDARAALTSQGMPQLPALAKVAANRKKRAGGAVKSKKKTQRYTPAGDPVPDLPRHRQKALFQHFLGPNVKIEEDAMEEVMDASQDFFAALMNDSSAFAQHAGRKHLINEQDLIMVLNRQRILTPKNRLQTHGRRLGLDRELQSVLDAIAVGEEEGKKGKGKGRKRARKESAGEGGAGGKRRKSAAGTGKRQARGKEVESESEGEEEGRVSYAEESEGSAE